MRQIHRAGEKLFVDYCGPTMAIVNPDTGEYREAQIFVAVLGASNYTFACASWSQQQADWLNAHVKVMVITPAAARLEVRRARPGISARPRATTT